MLDISLKNKLRKLKDINHTPRRFLLVDFGASLNHTHHKKSIYAFADLLEKQGFIHEIWVPIGSEVDRKNHNMKKILLPGTHPSAFKILKLSTWLPSTHGKFHNFGLIHNNKIILRLLLNLTATYFILQLLYRKLYKSEIIFTTLCPFSFQAIKLISRLKFRVLVYGRLTNTAEQRGILSEILDLDSLKEIKNIRFGYETTVFGEKLIKMGIVNIFSSKFPSQQQSRIDSIGKELQIISFLGYPTNNKGQKHIFPIVQSVARIRPEIKWLIQLRENDPIHSDLKSLNLNITFLHGKISQELMSESLKKTSLLCLPYDIDSFKFNSSAMMYEASDYLVPIITFSGSAFSSDVDEFNCGLTSGDEKDLIKKIVELESESIKKLQLGCEKYNKYRNQSNLDFLNITSKSVN